MTIADVNKIKLKRSFTDQGGPAFTSAVVAFNGVGDDAHEDFAIPLSFKNANEQNDDKGRMFDFCKTNHKPYNLAVIATLIVFNHHFGRDFVLSSDSDSTDTTGKKGKKIRTPTGDDWKQAMRECRAALGYGSGVTFITD